MKKTILILIGILIISSGIISQSTKNNNMPEEYLKVHHQDGLIYFEEFRIAELLLIPINDSIYRLDADIKTYDGPYSKVEVAEIEKRVGEKISNEFNYAWLTLHRLKIELKNIDDLDKIRFNIEDGFDDDLGINSCMIYFGWHIELYNNKIFFTKENGDLFINWTAESGDMNYYNEKAKPTYYEMKIKVNVIELKEEELSVRWKKLTNMGDRYYEIIRNMKGSPIKNHDLPVHEKVNEEIGLKHSVKAWKLVPEIIEKFPKDEKF